MRIAVLPFNSRPGVGEALGRQLAVFLSELMRQKMEGDEVGNINYMGREEESGTTKFFLAVPSEELNEAEIMRSMFQDGELGGAVDGLVDIDEDGSGSLTIRWFTQPESPEFSHSADWVSGGMLEALMTLFGKTLEGIRGESDPEPMSVATLFRTESQEAFVNAMIAFDAAQYIERANGQVVDRFSPEPAYIAAVRSIELEPEFENVFFCLIELSRLCFRYRLGDPDMAIQAMGKVLQLQPENPVFLFQIGRFMSDFGDAAQASELLEKASRIRPEAAPIWVGLGLAQVNLGMPANAERSFKRAVEMQEEDDQDLTAYDLLAQVMVQSNRGHEAPALYRAFIAKHPQFSAAHARLVEVMLANNDTVQAIEQANKSIEQLDESAPVKRVLAPVMRQQNELDRAMDLYEDVLDEDPANIGVLLEYADTLVAADRSFEAVKALGDVLKANPDPNTRAQTQAWLIELEQPKRVQAFQSAAEKADRGDHEGALREIKPLRNWLADYWKMWLLLAGIHNALSEHLQAEEAARQLLEMFPGCEPAYNEMANALTGQGRVEEAYHLMKMALSNMPQSLPVALSFGLAAARTGQSEEARQVARQIREAMGPNNDLEPILAEMEK